MKAEVIATWVEDAVVDKYEGYRKEVYVATKGNSQLILTCQRVEYPHGLHPHTNLTWIENGSSYLLRQDIVDEKYGQIKHSTGILEGDHGPNENLETIWRALYYKVLLEKAKWRVLELHPYNYSVERGDWEGGVKILSYPCCPFPGEKYGVVQTSLTEFWDKLQKCESGDDVNNLITSYPSQEGDVIWKE